MNKFFKKFHRFSPLVNQVQSRQKLPLNSFYIRSMHSFVFKKVQIEACRKALLRILKAENKLVEKKLPLFSNKKDFLGSLKICLFPSFPMSEKPKEARMGKGKGAISYFYFPVSKGRILFELHNVSFRVATLCFNSIFFKIPKSTRLSYSRY